MMKERSLIRMLRGLGNDVAISVPSGIVGGGGMKASPPRREDSKKKVSAHSFFK
jgi:hypothetical protein